MSAPLVPAAAAAIPVERESARTRRRLDSRWMCLLLACLLLALALAATATGAVKIPPARVVSIFAERIGLAAPSSFEEQERTIVLAIRLPRVVLGVLIGAALATSGAAMQGLFRNPLADPALIGISSGAACAAVFVIVLGARFFHGLAHTLGAWTLPLAAFCGGLAAMLVIHRIATVGGFTGIATMLLAGIAINALTSAATGLMTYTATDEQLRSLTFWSLGSLGGASWQSVLAAAPFIVVPLICMTLLAMPLNAILLGESEAGHLGFRVQKIKAGLIVCSALAVGVAVAMVGVVAFVGLVVPHLLRLWRGPDYRFLLPGSALLGGSLALGADLLARTLVAPAELPLGIVTAALGAPFFLWLLVRERENSSA